MKFVRFLILVAITSLPVLSLPAVAQQEIAPQHFDQPATKATTPVTRAKAGPKTAALKNQKQFTRNGRRQLAHYGTTASTEDSKPAHRCCPLDRQ